MCVDRWDFPTFSPPMFLLYEEGIPSSADRSPASRVSSSYRFQIKILPDRYPDFGVEVSESTFVERLLVVENLFQLLVESAKFALIIG